MSGEGMKFVVVKQPDMGQPEFERFLTAEVKHSKALCVFESQVAAEAFMLHAGISDEGWQLIEDAPEDIASLIERLMDWADMGYVVMNPLSRRFGPKSPHHSHGTSPQIGRKAVQPAQGEVETAWSFVSFLRGQSLRKNKR